jgi:hypothetical protein
MSTVITQQQLENLKDNKLLSQWERDFIKSIADQYAKSGKLSTNQERVLNTCLDKTSANKVKETQDWLASYGEEKRKIARLLAEYYKHEGYFQTLSNSILSDMAFVPSKEQYEKLCENKYAKKVIEAHNAPYEFQIGDLAIVRAGLRRTSITSMNKAASEMYHDYAKFVNQMVIVIEHDNSRPRTSKFVYFTLLTDPNTKYRCDEKFLKKVRNKKD